MLTETIKVGEAVTTCFVTLKVQDKQLCDRTIHYIECLTTLTFDSTSKFLIWCPTLLLQEKRGDGSAEQIRALLGNALMEPYEYDIDTFTKGFRMLTDNASVMARVAGASVNTRIAVVQPRKKENGEGTRMLERRGRKRLLG